MDSAVSIRLNTILSFYSATTAVKRFIYTVETRVEERCGVTHKMPDEDGLDVGGREMVSIWEEMKMMLLGTKNKIK